MRNHRTVFLIITLVLMVSCRARYLQIHFPRTTNQIVTGSEFYGSIKSMAWKEREAVAVPLLLGGDIPSFLLKFVPIRVSIFDTLQNKTIHAVYYVSPDYVSIGTNEDWARIPLTPMAAQKLADTLHCFLPTRKIVDDIYKQAQVKLPPVPLYAFRDSSLIMYHHHLIIEGQRRGRKGLIAGIKKDLVISGKLSQSNKADREAIYGWHEPNGQPIQPLYTGHINWWVDYSHGTRLVFRTVWVDGRPMAYTDVLQHPILKALLCDEAYCDVYRY